ncbi:MAG: DUF2089 domain-containing protein, partial [Chloroflexi bacterium]|nr:DUF2089 domain-containing protein [Chloroflexota bacterium]
MSKSSRIEILELLGKGKITAAEAATLLSDAPEKAAAPEKVSSPPPARVVKTAIKQSSTASDEAGKKPSWFHV